MGKVLVIGEQSKGVEEYLCHLKKLGKEIVRGTLDTKYKGSKFDIIFTSEIATMEDVKNIISLGEMK